MKISRVIDTKGGGRALTLGINAYASEFIKLCVERGIGALPIVDENGKLEGILTERDILRHCAKKTDFDTTPVAAIMTRNVVTVQCDDDIGKAMDLMIKGKMRHLPVMNGGQLAAMITVRDIIFAMRKAEQEEVEKLVAYLQSEITGGAEG